MWHGASDERSISEKQKPNSKWAANSKEVAASSKLSITKGSSIEQTSYRYSRKEYLQRKQMARGWMHSTQSTTAIQEQRTLMWARTMNLIANIEQ